MIRVPVALERAFRLATDVEAAYALLSDLPAWGALFPRVAALDSAGTDVWRWEMEPMGPPGFEARTVYACRYAFDARAHAVAWTPVDGVGNARFAGAVALASAPPDARAQPSTDGTLRLDAELEVPAPRFARAIVQPAVAFEMGRMVDTFLDRVRERLA